jgi:pyruvate dehydrogenase E2 component (dihydrolipoamide acetyltransferase)
MPARVFVLPDLGEGLEDADVVHWLVSVGDEVAADQPLVEVETAKANVEIPCPFAGTVTTIHAAAGDTVAVGAPLVTITVAEPATGAAPVRPLVGLGAGDDPPSRRRVAAPGGAATAPPAPSPIAVPAGRVLATPPVRKRARELGIDLAQVAGTGPDGAVTGRDLDAFLTAPAAPAAADSVRVPVQGVRRLIAEKMSTSRREIPDASTWVDADATELLALCESMNARGDGTKVTPLALILRACVAGLGRYPALNARYDETAREIELIGSVHLGFAAQTERGLVVPVIRDAHTLSTDAIARELRRLADAARDGSITPAELIGSTFTVSNYGAFGVDGGVAIINHPEVAILGVGRIVPKPWVVDGVVTARSVVQLSLSFDHRVMDGGDAGGFVRFVADCVESPAALVGVL